jgi:DedD protein
VAKKSDAIVRISRKGVLIWGALMLFICGWMFVLGILVGRGSAPVDLDAGKLEQEFETLRAAMAKKEQAQVDAVTAANGADKPELGFYEALKENKTSRRIKMPPAKAVQPVPAVVKPIKSPPPPKPKPAPAPEKTPPPKTDDGETPGPKAASSKGRFTLQVAAVKEMGNAERLVSDLRKKGYPAYQVRVAVPGKGAWHRVRVGAYENRADADQMLNKLKAKQINAIVVETK